MFSTIRITIKIRTGLLYLRNSTPPSARHKLDRRYFYAINSENCVLAEETVQTEKIDSGKYQLADQNPPQISLHTDHGNGKNTNNSRIKRQTTLEKKIRPAMPRPCKMLESVVSRYKKDR